ncbi:MAG: DUF4174 domain-containing protein [Cyanobacteria bacterium P01_D01_bin.156]
MKYSIRLWAILSALTMVAYASPRNITHPETKATTTVQALMEDYQWDKRVLLIFSPSDGAPERTQQADYLSAMGAGLNARDLVVWEFINNGSVLRNGEMETDMSSQPFYEYFDVKNTEFTVLLFGKDGTEKLRRTQPVTSNRLFTLIDAMPMRQREMYGH